MRIGFFTDTYFPQISGVATSIKTLKEELEQRGHEVLIFTTTDPKATDDPAIFRMPSIPFVSFTDRRIVVSGISAAVEIAKDLELDIIHTHTEFGEGLIGKHTAKHLGIPVVHTYHTMYEDYLHYIAHGKLIRPYHVKQASRAFCRHLSGIVCPSQRVVDKLRQYQIHTPMEVIPTGVDIEKFRVYETNQAQEEPSLREKFHIPAADTLLLSLSRLSYEKNIQALIMGLPAILKKQPATTLLIVGGGPYLEELVALSEAQGVAEKVIFAGEVENDQVPMYYHQADYFVSASDSESQGLTYIEALAANTKVVAKGNDYLNQLFDDPSLGQTFATDDEFATAYLTYRAQTHPADAAVREAKLYEISSKNFARRIEAFYIDAMSYYQTYQLEDEAKESLSLRLFKRKE